ncbi:MAG: thiolase family protein [Chloroflexi bacterium]|nr:thiolase family protein [Chloroflexota bacterium]
MSDKAICEKTAIVGIGSSDFRALYAERDPERTAEDLAVAAVRDALDDAGLKRDDIDGLITAGVGHYEPFGFRSGLKDVRFLADYPSGGRMCAIALAHAAMAVHHGLANYVVMFNSVVFRSAGARFGGGPAQGGGPPQGNLYDAIAGMASPGALYALAFTRYQHLYGATEEQLGEIAVAIRNNSVLNPIASLQQHITIDDYMQSRYVARPLRLFDYCLINDGAVAYIVTTAERAKDLRHPPVYIASFAEQATLREHYVAEDFWYDACGSMRADLLDSIGLSIQDVDSVQVYDNFSVSVLWGLEGFGFAPRGQGLDWLKGGRIALGGELPVNTSGGMMAEAYLQGWNNHAEAVRQLRGEAGERQVPNCRTILYWCLSAVPGGTVLTNGGGA